VSLPYHALLKTHRNGLLDYALDRAHDNPNPASRPPGGEQLVESGWFVRLPARVERRFAPPALGRFFRYGTHADGSCFFHSIAAAMGERVLIPDSHHKGSYREVSYHDASAPNRRAAGLNLRKRIQVHFMTMAPEQWLDFWKARIPAYKIAHVPLLASLRDQISSSKAWVNVYSIVYIMVLLGVDFKFFDMDGNQLFCGVTNRTMENPPVILIMWVNRSHFEPLIQCHTHANGRRVLNGVYQPDSDIVRHVNSLYQHGCALTPLGRVIG